MQHQDNEGNWRAEKLFRNFMFYNLFHPLVVKKNNKLR